MKIVYNYNYDLESHLKVNIDYYFLKFSTIHNNENNNNIFWYLLAAAKNRTARTMEYFILKRSEYTVISGIHSGIYTEILFTKTR